MTMEGPTNMQEMFLDLEERDIKENRSEKENVTYLFAQFLEIFPFEKEEIEECIRCIQQEAEKIDETHKGCTIANITTSFVGATSGILTILGLALAPVTAGGTLILTITGFGLGAAAGVTGISTSISESIINSKKNKKAQQLINKCQEKLSLLMILIGSNFAFYPNNKAIQQEIFQHLTSSLGTTVKGPSLAYAVKNIVSNAEALQRATGNAALKALAKQAAATGSTARASLKGIEQVEGAFKGTALAMSKGTRVLGATVAGAFLLLDAFFIVKDAVHLTKGAKTETASEIRNRASELKETLNKLNKFYEDLRNVM